VNLGQPVPLDSTSPNVLFNTIPQCPFQTEGGEKSAVKEEEWGKVHSTRGNWWRDFEARCPSCHQPVLKSFKTSNVTHPFFNHQQTPEGRDVTPFHVLSQMSVAYPCIVCNVFVLFFLVIVWAAMTEWLRWYGCDSCWDLYELMMASTGVWTLKLIFSSATNRITRKGTPLTFISARQTR